MLDKYASINEYLVINIPRHSCPSSSIYYFSKHFRVQERLTDSLLLIRRICGRPLEDSLDDIRASSAWVATRSSHVVVDSADKDLSYDHLASGLKTALQIDRSAFDAHRLQKPTGPQLRELLRWPRPLPLEDERVRLLHEVGFELERNFEGKASDLVESCGKSAVKLVDLVTCFRDHSVYKGHQVFLYKKAQIFAADLWGAFRGQGYGEFKDVSSITIMADYIITAVLQPLGVLKYSPRLTFTIEASGEIGPGSEEEVELWACSVHAVEKMRELFSVKSGRQCSVWSHHWVWASGVHCPSLQHHRTLSIYY